MPFSSPEPLGLICNEPRDQDKGGGGKLTGEVVREDIPHFSPCY